MTTNDQGSSATGDGATPARRPDPVGELEQAGRLLDTPLLAGDEVPPLAPVPQVKQLVWEHVVRPLDGTPAGGLPRISPSTPPAAPSPAVAPPSVPGPSPVESVGSDTVPSPMPSFDLSPSLPVVPLGTSPTEDRVEDVIDARTKGHVTAEIDRLAFVPDGAAAPEQVAAVEGSGEILIVEATPTTPLPTTTAAGVPSPATPAGGMPSLPPSNVDPVRPQSAPPPAPAAAATRPAAASGSRRSYAELAGAMQPAARPKRKRRVFRKLFTMAFVLGIIGGGLVAARHYLIDPQWADDIAPLADEVATARQLEFLSTVPVVEQTPTVYSIMLAESVLGLSEAVVDDTAGEWRAMGLLNGVLDTGVIGRTAIPDQPAFYDPATKSVQVVNGLPADLRAFALQRALTMALLDQHYAWSTADASTAPAVTTGTRMLYEADALETALSLVTEAERRAIGTQMTEQFTRLEVPSSPSPYATALLSRLGVAMWPWFRELPEGDRTSLLTGARPTDATLLDLRRFAESAPAAGAAPVTTIAGRVPSSAESVPAGTRGMLYWYHVLASRVDADLAWRAALSWQADQLTAERTAGRVCVAAVFESDVAGGDFARLAFEQWASTSPQSATVLVTDRAVDPSTGAPTGLQIAVDVCDPGPTTDTNDGRSRLALGGSPLRTEQFVRLLEEHSDVTRQQAACLVYGIDPVTVGDERGVIDGLSGWSAPDQHPAIDPTLPCPATGPSAEAVPTTTTP